MFQFLTTLKIQGLAVKGFEVNWKRIFSWNRNGETGTKIVIFECV